MRFLAVFVLVVAASCSSTQLSESGYQLTEKKEYNQLLSPEFIEGAQMRLEIVRPELEMGWHRTLQKAEIKEPEIQKKLLSALAASVEKMNNNGYGCFEPRYRLIISKGKEKVVADISFACRKMYLRKGDKVTALAVHDDALDLFYAEARKRGLDKARNDRFE